MVPKDKIEDQVLSSTAPAFTADQLYATEEAPRFEDFTLPHSYASSQWPLDVAGREATVQALEEQVEEYLRSTTDNDDPLRHMSVQPILSLIEDLKGQQDELES